MKLHSTLLIACLGAAPLCAQQVEPKPEAPKPAAGDAAATGSTGATGSAIGRGSASGGVNPGAQTTPPPPSRRPSHSQSMPQPEQKPVAYIGVLTREVSPELRAQFSLPEGFGLLVGEVMPDSPAKTAGLKVFDVLVKFEDQQLVNMEQLMALVRAKKKGDVVQLDVITGGKETKVPVTLGEHHFEAEEHPQHRGFQLQAHSMQEQLEGHQHAMQEIREQRERVQQWVKDGRIGPMPMPKVPMFDPMPMPPTLNKPGAGQQSHDEGRRHHRQPQTGISIPPGTDLQRFQFSQTHNAANITRRDDSGEYTLKNEDGKKTFIAHPKNGQEQSWPVNTDAERQAVPQDLRDKLRMMDGTGTGIRIQINPGPGTNVPGSPAPTGGATPPAVPPVKAQTTSA